LQRAAIGEVVFERANTTLDTDGFAEGERFLGTPQFTGSRFTLRVHEDLRGLLSMATRS
jgi:hypothetical protein